MGNPGTPRHAYNPQHAFLSNLVNYFLKHTTPHIQQSSAHVLTLLHGTCLSKLFLQWLGNEDEKHRASSINKVSRKHLLEQSLWCLYIELQEGCSIFKGLLWKKHWNSVNSFSCEHSFFPFFFSQKVIAEEGCKSTRLIPERLEPSWTNGS